jgi:pimeloyl-ACP methyl ester carboxylesterase
LTEIGPENSPSREAPRERLKPPSRLLLLAEWRALLELGLGLASAPILMLAPRGDGHSVLVLPGFLAGDTSTELLRRYLRLLGYRSYAWKFGPNLGGAYRMRTKLRQRLAEVYQATGRKVSLIGWSLGGVYARDLALFMPDAVRYVITLGSPFAKDITATNVRGLYEFVTGESTDDVPREELERLQGDLPVPTSAIFSRTDGIVHWRTCMVNENHQAENIEVWGSHAGFGVNPTVLWAIADRLAQREGHFECFDRKGPFWFAYPR